MMSMSRFCSLWWMEKATERPGRGASGLEPRLAFPADKRDFKSSVSKQPWQSFDTALEPRNRVQRFSILIYNLTEQGNVEIGPLRMLK